MAGDDDIREGQQSGNGIVFNNAFGQVEKENAYFLLVNVNTQIAQMPGYYCLFHILSVWLATLWMIKLQFLKLDA